MCVRPCGGCGRSRFSAYHGWSRSRNRTSWPRAVNSRTRARYVVAWPFPHEDVIDRPRNTIERRSDMAASGNGGRAAIGKDGRDFPRTVRIRVFGKHAAPGAFTDRTGGAFVQPVEVSGHLLARRCDEHLALGLEEELDALPRIGHETRGGPGGLEHAGGRREPVTGHALAVHVQDGTRRGIEGVVVRREHVPGVADVRGPRLVVPAASP